jgi:hypothetical protein
MLLSKSNKQLAAKLLLTAVLLAVLAGFAGSKLVLTVPLSMVLLYSLIGAIALFGVITLAVAVVQMFNQFILRHGGTDTQWFWFSSEPAGLVKLRAQSRNAQVNAPK